MEHLNHALFFWINAPKHPSTLLSTITTFFAEYVIWVLSVLIGIGWLRGSKPIRKIRLVATASGLLGLFTNQITVSRTLLFWAAFILTRPLGAVVGDFLDKPLNASGLALSRYSASAALFAFILILEDRFYGWGEEVESNAVEFLVHALRRKLGSDVIKNVKGVRWVVSKNV